MTRRSSTRHCRLATTLRVELEPFANERGNLAFVLSRPVPVQLIVRVAVALAEQYKG